MNAQASVTTCGASSSVATNVYSDDVYFILNFDDAGNGTCTIDTNASPNPTSSSSGVLNGFSFFIDDDDIELDTLFVGGTDVNMGNAPPYSIVTSQSVSSSAVSPCSQQNFPTTGDNYLLNIDNCVDADFAASVQVVIGSGTYAGTYNIALNVDGMHDTSNLVGVSSFSITGGNFSSASAPEIAISSSETGAVADAGTDAQGSEPAGTSKTVTYTITNSGTDTLTLTGSAASLSNASNVSATSVGNYGSTTIAASGGTTTFTVTYTPALAGAFSFDLDVISDDADEANYDIAVSGTATGAPEIAISSSETGAVADAGTDAQGSEPAGTSKTVTYTITNSGTDTLTLTGSAASLSNASNVSATSVGNYGSTTIAASGGTTTFTVTYTPALAGAFSFDLDVISDDADEANYDIAVSGTATGAPEIAISSSETGAVADAGTDAQGSEPAGTSKTVTYTITNSGTDTLTLTGSAASLSNASNVSATSVGNYGSTTIAASGGTTTFTVTYTPALAGAFSFDLDVISDDADEANYDIAVSGTATGAPEIAISSSETGAVADAGTDAQGSEPAGTSKTVTYTITNSGTDTLTLTGSAASLSNASNVSATSVGNYGSTTIAASGGTTTFTVTYTPALAGAFSFDLDVISDDADEANYDIAVSGTATGAPEIAISSSETGAVADAGTDAQGSEPAGTSKTVTYTITNSGTDTLTLTGSAASLSNATNVGATSVGNYGSTSIAASGGTTTFTVTYTPALAGAFSFDLDVISDDADEANYDIAVSGTATGAPEIAISSSETGAVADAGTDAQGSEPAGISKTVTYTITNSGTDTLTLTGSAASLSNATNLSSTSVGNYGSTTIAASGGTTTFTVTYTPALAGAFSFDLDVNSDDADEANYDIAVSGTATGTPEINLVGNSNSISSGTSAITTNGTDFGGIDRLTGSDTHTFTIENTGTADLIISSVTSDNSAEFSVDDTSVGSPIAAGNTGSFSVTFDPSAAGARSATITISNSDPDEGSYTLPLAGTGTQSPEINLVGNSSSIPSGTSASVANDTDFANIDTTTSDTHTFTIQNLGSGPLIISSVSSDNSAEFSVDDTGVGPSIASGGQGTFTVSFNPNTTGARSATITIISDDADENIYTLPMAGIGIDATAPNIVSIERNSPTTETTDADTVTWRITFNEDVSGVDITDFSISGSTATATLVNAISNSIYDVTVSGGDLASLESTITLQTIIGAGNIEDLSGNDLTNSTPTTTNDNTYIITNDTTSPTLLVGGAPTTHDRKTSFDISFIFSEDVTGFVSGDVTLTGAVMSNFLSVNATTYAATIAPSGVSDITIDIAGAVAQDLAGNNNLAAEQVKVKSTIVEETEKVIANFMTNRANNIIGNQADMIGFVTNLNNAGGGPLGNLQLDSDLDDQITMSFYTSRSKILASQDAQSNKGDRHRADSDLKQFATADRFSAIDEIEDEMLSFSKPKDEEDTSPAAQTYLQSEREGSWDIWTQIYGAKSSQNDLKSEFWSANFGAHYFLTKDVLVGVLTQFDWAEEKDTSISSTVSGNGFLIGPYIAGKFQDQNLYYEARALWGQSKNEITPIGTYTDSFETERWLASLKLQGAHNFQNDIMIKPEIAVSYFEETQESYIDTNSNIISEQKISFGEFKFGPTIARTFEIGAGFKMQASLGISGIANFAVKNANTASNSSFANDNMRARIDAGLEVENEYDIRFTAAGYYDGIGSSDFKSYGYTLGLIIPIY